MTEHFSSIMKASYQDLETRTEYIFTQSFEECALYLSVKHLVFSPFYKCRSFFNKNFQPSFTMALNSGFKVRIMDHYDCLGIRLKDVCFSVSSGEIVTQNDKSGDCSVYLHFCVRSTQRNLKFSNDFSLLYSLIIFCSFICKSNF